MPTFINELSIFFILFVQIKMLKLIIRLKYLSLIGKHMKQLFFLFLLMVLINVKVLFNIAKIIPGKDYLNPDIFLIVDD